MAVTRTHANMSREGDHTVSTQVRVQDLRPGDVDLITLATCHVAGLFGQLLPTLQSGGCCLLHSRYDPTAAALEIERSRVTRIQLLQAQLATLLDAAEADSRDLSSLRCAIVGGDTLTLDLHDRFREVSNPQTVAIDSIHGYIYWTPRFLRAPAGGVRERQAPGSLASIGACRRSRTCCSGRRSRGFCRPAGT